MEALGKSSSVRGQKVHSLFYLYHLVHLRLAFFAISLQLSQDSSGSLHVQDGMVWPYLLDMSLLFQRL